MRLFNEIAKRSVAFLLLAVTAFGAVTYSLGLYEISFIDRDDDGFDDRTTQEILGTLEPGTNISDFTGDITTVTPPPDISDFVSTVLPEISLPSATDPGESTSGITDTESGTESGSETAPAPSGPVTLAEFLDAGYRITWRDYDPDMQMAELVLDFEGNDRYTLGSTKRVRMKLKMDYGEAHREVTYYAMRQKERPALEMYM